MYANSKLKLSEKKLELPYKILCPAWCGGADSTVLARKIENLNQAWAT
jgi:hypothetical protein